MQDSLHGDSGVVESKHLSNAGFSLLTGSHRFSLFSQTACRVILLYCCAQSIIINDLFYMFPGMIYKVIYNHCSCNHIKMKSILPNMKANKSLHNSSSSFFSLHYALVMTLHCQLKRVTVHHKVHSYISFNAIYFVYVV